MTIEAYLTELGVTAVATERTFEDGLRAAGEGAFDFALLDVNLNGQPSFPIAAVLRQRGVPLLFQTGYGKAGLEAPFGDCPVLSKPYGPDALREALARLVSTPDDSASDRRASSGARD